MACKQRNLQAARFLLENGADVNAADLEKMTGALPFIGFERTVLPVSSRC